MRTALVTLLALVLAGCAGPPASSPGPGRPHHTPEGFRNTTIGTVNKPLGELLRWRWEAWRDDLPPAPQAPTPVAMPELARLKAYASAMRHVGTAAAVPAPSVTWIGHATALVQSGGLNVLTDPIFSERASPVQFLGPRRAQPPGVALEDLPPVDVVVISHNHYDHLDRLSVLQLDARSGGRTLFLVPLGIKAWMADLGIRNVVELDWWETHLHRGVEFQLVPVQHWSARSLNDRNRTLWGGWTVEHAVEGRLRRFYFAGDTAYVQALFQEIRHRVGPIDLAALPIGAYQPRAAMRFEHTDPAEAVRAQADLGSPPAFGVHWATFQLGDEEPFQPALDLAEALKASPTSPFGVLPIGAIVDVLPEGASAAGLLPPHRMRPVPAR